MTKSYPSEIWKDVKFNIESTNKYRLEVSNYGRIRSFNVLSNGNILKGSMVNGYRIIRLKFFKPRNPEIQSAITSLQQQVMALNEEIKLLKQTTGTEVKVSEALKLLGDVKKKLSRQFKIDAKDRTIHYHSLVHKLVAEYFCTKPSPKHTVVSHLDYNKLNNYSNNLVWMTREENFVHQQKSPFVIENRDLKSSTVTKTAKLTITKVMLLKKLLSQGKPLRTLVKQFKVTDTQILRIKRGENWANIPAAN